MNRFMVWMGFGSLLMPFCMTANSPLAAEMPTYVSASGIAKAPVVWHETLEDGWRESRRRGIPMVIYITSDRCSYCDAMKRNTWCDESIRHRLSREFVAIRLKRGRNSATLGRIDIQTYPTTLVGVPEGKIVSHRTGYQPPSALHGLLTEAKNRRRSRR